MTATELNDLFWFHMDEVLENARLPITEDELQARADE